MPTFALNFSRPGAEVVAQYYTFFRLGPRRLPGWCSRRAATSPRTWRPAIERPRLLSLMISRGPSAAGVRVHHQAGGEGVGRL